MKLSNISPKMLAIFVTGLLILISLSFLNGCNNGQPVTQILPTTAATPGPSSNWDACQYWYSTAFGSLDANNPETTSSLDWCDASQDIVANGYVTTDNTGQAKMTNETCTLYIFQGGDVEVLSDVSVSFCPEGDPCVVGADGNCTAFTVVNLGDTEVTFEGTTVIIINDHKIGVVLILVPDGTVNVKPGDGSTPFSIGPNQAAYVVSADYKKAAFDLFGFDAGQMMEFGRTTDAIEMMGFTPQIQQANLTLLRLELPIIPISVPYEMGFRWINDVIENQSVSLAIAQSVDWKSFYESYFPQARLIFQTKNETWDLSAYEYNLQSAGEWLAQGGIQQGQEVILVYDESIPGLAEMAEQIRQNLTKIGGLTVTLKTTTPENMHELFPMFELEKSPVLYLGGF